jgi:hypothetical protein
MNCQDRRARAAAELPVYRPNMRLSCLPSPHSPLCRANSQPHPLDRWPAQFRLLHLAEAADRVSTPEG